MTYPYPSVWRRFLGLTKDVRRMLVHFVTHHRFLVIVAPLLFFLYSYTNLFYGNWLIHPDDHGDFVIAKAVWEQWAFRIREPLNEIVGFASFTPAGTTYVDGWVVPIHSAPTQLLYALGWVAGQQGQFYVVSSHGVAAVILFFYLMKRVWGFSAAVISSVVFGLSFPMVYWSNMLFSNVPALAYFIGGLCLLHRAAETGRRRTWLLAWIPLSISYMIRYEYLLLVVVVGGWFLYRGHRDKKVVALSLGYLASTLIALAMMNNFLYGNPLRLGYTVSPELRGAEFSDPIQSLIDREFLHIVAPSLPLLAQNAYNHIIRLYFPILPLTAAGLLLILRKSNPKANQFTVPFIICSLLWGYYVLNARFHAADTGWFGISYTRLLLPVYMMMAYFMGPVLSRSWLRRRWGLIVLLLTVLALTTSSANYLENGVLGLTDTIEEKLFYKEIDARVSTLPEDSVIFGNLVSKGIVSRSVLDLNLVSLSPEERIEIALQSLQILLENGYPVYLIELPWHSATYLGINRLIESMGYSTAPVDEVTFRGRIVPILEVTG